MKRTIKIELDDETRIVTITQTNGQTYYLNDTEVVWTREPEIDRAAEDAAMDGLRRWKPGKRIGLSVTGTVVEEGE